MVHSVNPGGTPGLTPTGPARIEGAPRGPARAPVEQDKLRRACQEFESLLLAHLLKGMRETASALGDREPVTGAGLMTELMDEHLARVLARGGGLGLARMLEAGLRHRTSAKEGGEGVPSVPETIGDHE